MLLVYIVGAICLSEILKPENYYVTMKIWKYLPFTTKFFGMVETFTIRMGSSNHAIGRFLGHIVWAKVRNKLWLIFHIYDVKRSQYYCRQLDRKSLECMRATRKLEWAARLY